MTSPTRHAGHRPGGGLTVGAEQTDLAGNVGTSTDSNTDVTFTMNTTTYSAENAVTDSQLNQVCRLTVRSSPATVGHSLTAATPSTLVRSRVTCGSI